MRNVLSAGFAAAALVLALLFSSGTEGPKPAFAQSASCGSGATVLCESRCLCFDVIIAYWCSCDYKYLPPDKPAKDSTKTEPNPLETDPAT
jgi:hypothetical protein